MTFLEALKQATTLALHGDLAGAEAVLHSYFHPADGEVHTNDGGTGQGGGPK